MDNPLDKRMHENNNNDPRRHQMPPKNWLVESILLTVLCCPAFGIVAIISATKVESRFFAGDYTGAQKAADAAKKWVLWGLGLSIVGIFLYLVFFVFLGILSEL